MTNIQSAARNIVSVALADIQPSSYNPRKTFDETSLAELAESIRQQGVLQPIGVRPIEENRYEVIFGERRYRASLMAGLETIPAIMHEVTDEVAGGGNGGHGEPSAQGCDAHRGSQRLSETDRERSARCSFVGGAVRKVGGLHPHKAQIYNLDTRNRSPLGNGRDNYQCGK